MTYITEKYLKSTEKSQRDKFIKQTNKKETEEETLLERSKRDLKIYLYIYIYIYIYRERERERIIMR